MSNALIYSAGFDGHRQVYVFVLSKILKESGYKVFIAGNICEELSDSTYLNKLKEDSAIDFIDTSGYAEGGLKINLAEIINIQTDKKIGLTIFAEGDHHIQVFTAQLLKKRGKRLVGKNVAIFLRPFFLYRRVGFIGWLRYIKGLKANFFKDERVFHSFLSRIFKLLDSSLYIDEFFTSKHSFSTWMPDVFQQYAETIITEEYSEQRRWIPIIDEFKTKNDGNFMILYFGTSQKRRGYDVLLKLAVKEGACFIHCGLNTDDGKFDNDVESLKSDLAKNGRLLETNEYISDPTCIESFFKLATHILLPYRDFYGSSGVMLQALTYGIPVLVPKGGLMAYRVKKHKLGMVYNGTEKSLIERFAKFRNTSPKDYSIFIENYMRSQTNDKLEQVLRNALS